MPETQGARPLRVLLLSVNRSSSRSRSNPLGLECLRAVCAGAGMDNAPSGLQHAGGRPEELRRRAAEYVLIRAGFNKKCGQHRIRRDPLLCAGSVRAVQALRRRFGCGYNCRGQRFSLFPREILRETGADWASKARRGDFGRVVEGLQAASDVSHLPGW